MGKRIQIAIKNFDGNLREEIKSHLNNQGFVTDVWCDREDVICMYKDVCLRFSILIEELKLDMIGSFYVYVKFVTFVDVEEIEEQV